MNTEGVASYPKTTVLGLGNCFPLVITIIWIVAIVATWPRFWYLLLYIVFVDVAWLRTSVLAASIGDDSVRILRISGWEYLPFSEITEIRVSIGPIRRTRIVTRRRWPNTSLFIYGPDPGIARFVEAAKATSIKIRTGVFY